MSHDVHHARILDLNAERLRLVAQRDAELAAYSTGTGSRDRIAQLGRQIANFDEELDLERAALQGAAAVARSPERAKRRTEARELAAAVAASGAQRLALARRLDEAVEILAESMAAFVAATATTSKQAHRAVSLAQPHGGKDRFAHGYMVDALHPRGGSFVVAAAAALRDVFAPLDDRGGHIFQFAPGIQFPSVHRVTFEEITQHIVDRTPGQLAGVVETSCAAEEALVADLAKLTA